MTPKLKKILIITYIISLVVITTFVVIVLKSKSVRVSTKTPEKIAQEVKPAKVDLIVIQENKVNKYHYILKNVDNISDLLNTVRDDKKIYFEMTQYINHVTIDIVDSIPSNEHLGWRIFNNRTDITNDINTLTLEDGGIYELKYVPLQD